MKSISLFLSSLLIFCNTIYSQDWVHLISDTSKSYYEIKESFNNHWRGKEVQRSSGWKQFQRWAWYMEPRVYPSGNRIAVNTAYKERNKFIETYGNSSSRSSGWSPIGPSEWTTISSGYNPGIGRVNVVAEHPNDANILYAGSPSGGLWKSENNGVTWSPKTDHFSAIGVSGIAIDYSNPNTIYISTGDMDGFDTYSIGVMKSEDGGETWSPTGLTHNLSQFIVCRKLIMHPENPTTLLVATSNGLYKTNNSGDTWTQVASGSFRDIEFKPGDPSIVYASTNKLFRSTNSGNSFTEISAGLPPSDNVNRMEIAVSQNQPDWLYVLCGNNDNQNYLGLWRSTNSGVTFELRSNSPNLFGYSETGDDDSGQSWFDMAIDVSQSDANTVLLGGVNVWRSSNGGTSFTISSHWVYPSSIGYTHADIHTLHYFGNNLYCGSDGGLFKSSNNGNTWSDLTPGMEITQFYRLGLSAQNPDIIIGGSQDNGSNLLNNNTWTHVMGADGMEAAVNPSNSNILFCTQQFGALHRSIDGGNNWENIFDGNGESGGWVTPYLSLSGNQVIAGYENVWKSTNNGTTFNQISNFNTGSSINDIGVCKNNVNYIYVAIDGRIHRTINGGTTWEDRTSNLPNLSITDIQVHPEFPDIVWISVSGYQNGNKVFVTTNGGENWTNISQNLPNLPCNTIVYQEGTNGGIYVGMDVGIYYKDSTLSNWQTFDQELPNVIVTELEIQYGAGLLRAATYGRGIWEAQLYTPTSLAPIADFVFNNESLCITDSISFYDGSSFASPGWSWLFPGGSPSSSNEANPNVFYPSSGTYEVSLEISNDNGTHSITKTIEVNFGENEITVYINTDNYPDETSWIITNSDGNTLAIEGYSASNTAHERVVCLTSGCYTFTITDAYGDGICCDYGNGSYSILNDNGELLFNGGNFETSESHVFCFENTSNSIKENYNQLFNMHPNPANNRLEIQTYQSETGDLSILDMNGKEIVNIPLFATGSIDISKLTGGVYHVRYTTNSTSQERKLIVIR